MIPVNFSDIESLIEANRQVRSQICAFLGKSDPVILSGYIVATSDKDFQRIRNDLSVFVAQCYRYLMENNRRLVLALLLRKRLRNRLLSIYFLLEYAHKVEICLTSLASSLAVSSNPFEFANTLPLCFDRIQSENKHYLPFSISSPFSLPKAPKL